MSSTYRLRRQNSSHPRIRDTVIRFKTDFQKQCLLNCCEERQWVLTDSEDEWNVYWANVGKVRRIFNLESGIRLRDDQIVNHFPNHYELTRKDSMVKNIKRYKKQLEKQGHMKAALLVDFVPLSYTLPVDYPIFEDEFRRQVLYQQKKKQQLDDKNKDSDATTAVPSMSVPMSGVTHLFHSKQRGLKWILKPSSRAQGSGIVIINRLSQLKRWTNSSKYNSSETYVISKYVEKPLLIGGRKFDLRLFALVVSYRPLKIYMYSQGFARFSNVKYTTERDQMNNTEVHLTNVAIQKHSDEYNANHGNKWSFDNVMLYIASNFGDATAEMCLKRIQQIVIYSCLAVKNVMIADKHCFECYGYDIIIDQQLKPWLIEINASPSLSATTKADRTFKEKLIFDLFQVIVPPPTSDEHDAAENMKKTRKQIGDFYLLYAELNNDGASYDASEVGHDDRNQTCTVEKDESRAQLLANDSTPALSARRTSTQRRKQKATWR